MQNEDQLTISSMKTKNCDKTIEHLEQKIEELRIANALKRPNLSTRTCGS